MTNYENREKKGMFKLRHDFNCFAIILDALEDEGNYLESINLNSFSNSKTSNINVLYAFNSQDNLFCPLQLFSIF